MNAAIPNYNPRSPRMGCQMGPPVHYCPTCHCYPCVCEEDWDEPEEPWVANLERWGAIKPKDRQ